MNSSSHVHLVFLPAELYIGIARVQAELEIGKSAAILLMVTEGLFLNRFITRQEYEKYVSRYKTKLVEKVAESGRLERCGFAGCKNPAVGVGVWRGKEEVLLCEVHLLKAKAKPEEWVVVSGGSV